MGARGLGSGVVYLGNMDEFREDLSPELGSGPAQDHELDPLGDAVTEGNGALHHLVVLHAASAYVVLVVCKLTELPSVT